MTAAAAAAGSDLPGLGLLELGLLEPGLLEQRSGRSAPALLRAR